MVLLFVLLEYHHNKGLYSFKVQGRDLLAEVEEPARLQRSIGDGKYRSKIMSMKIGKGSRVSLFTTTGCLLVAARAENEVSDWFTNLETATKQESDPCSEISRQT